MRFEDPWTRAAIPLPDGWTALPGRGALPLLATDRSGGDGVFAPMDGELDGRLVRETLVSSMVGSSGVSTITHYLTVDGLDDRA